MKDLYQEILDQHIAPGQMFETKDVVNENGVTFKEYINLPDSLRGYLDFALAHAEKECLIYEDERYTYKEVFEKSAQTGNALIEAGIQKGDRVAICMQNNPEVVYSYFGIVGIGAVCVPLNSWWVPSEVIYGLEHSDAKLLIADKRLSNFLFVSVLISKRLSIDCLTEDILSSVTSKSCSLLIWLRIMFFANFIFSFLVCREIFK